MATPPSSRRPFGRRWRPPFARASLVGAALACAAGAHAAPPPPPAGALLEGDASNCSVDAPANCAPLRPGEALHPLSTITSEAGATVRLPGGALVRLEPGAKLRLVRTMMIPLRSNDGTIAQVVRLESGTALVTVPAAYAYRTAVMFQFSATRNVLAKEGITAAHAGPEGVSAGAVLGVALVTTDGRAWQLLRQGRGRRFAPGATEGVDYALLRAPAVLPSARLGLHQPGRPPPTLRWNPVEGAIAYDLRLTQDGRQEPLRALRVPAAQTSIAFDGLAPGAYALALQTVDAQGVPGAPSEPMPLTMLDVALPLGVAIGESGQIRLGAHQRLSLSPIDRVQASLGLDAPFGPAPAQVGVGSQGARLVRLRQEGDESSVELLLVRRPLRALVELGPATAHWPATPVRVSVRLVDELGQPFNPPPPVQPQVRLGLELLEVAWQADGATLTATIEPQPLAGPSVLRVEIEDDRGQIVGRNFLELVPEAPAPPPAPAVHAPGAHAPGAHARATAPLPPP